MVRRTTRARMPDGASPVSVEIQQAAEFMLAELDAMKLTVACVPGDPDKCASGVRVVVCPNPDWYSRLCNDYLAQRHVRKWRRPRTQIRRVDVRRTLATLCRGWRGTGAYFDRVLQVLAWWRDVHDFESAERFEPDQQPEPQQETTHVF